MSKFVEELHGWPLVSLIIYFSYYVQAFVNDIHIGLIFYLSSFKSVSTIIVYKFQSEVHTLN